MTTAAHVVAIRADVVTLEAAADAFLSSPRCENPKTRRAYAGVVDKVIGQLGELRPLAEVTRSKSAVWSKGSGEPLGHRRGTATGLR